MEGFAVAMGGRGGMAPRVVTDVGYYLQKTAFLTYDSILTYDAFTSQDANMTYAVSGLYNMFLFNELGAGKYLELYKKVNGDLEKVKLQNASDLQIPDKNQFNDFLKFYDQNNPVKLENKGMLPYPCPTPFDCIVIFREGQIEENFYYFNTIYHIFSFTLDKSNIFPDYISKLYTNELANKTADGLNWGGMNQYVINLDSTKLRLYNCLNDELEASYDVNFSIDHKKLPVFREYVIVGSYTLYSGPGYFLFSFADNLFDSKFPEHKWK